MINKYKQLLSIPNSKLKSLDQIAQDFHLPNLDMIPRLLDVQKLLPHLLKEWILENHQVENRYIDIQFIILLLMK